MTQARMEIEAVFRCPTCKGMPYKLFRRSTEANPDVFTHLVCPTDPSVPPPLEPTLRCPRDGADLVRGTA